MLSVSMWYNMQGMHVWFLASDSFTECCCHASLITCHFQKFLDFSAVKMATHVQKFLDFSAVKMATHEVLITLLYTIFCPISFIGNYRTVSE